MSTTILTEQPDINLFSIAGSANQTAFNPNASTNPADEQVGVPIPSPLILTPSNSTSFASILKIGDNSGNLTLGGTDAVISQGSEGCIDLNNMVANVTVTAQFGIDSTARGQRVSSIKGGCSKVKIAGPLVCRGNETDHLLGQWSDQSQQVDTYIDYSGTSGRVTIVRGLFAYLIGNRNHISLGSNCRLDIWESLDNWLYLRFIKTPYVWYLSVKAIFV